MEFFTFFILSVLIKSSVSANILCIFPKPAYSHQLVFRSITEKLLENGHKITLVSTHPSESERTHENVTLIDVSFSVEIMQDALDRFHASEKKSFKTLIFQIIENEAFIIDKQLETNEMQKLIKDSTVKFDLLLLETGGMAPMHAFAEHFKVPVVGITSADSLSPGHEVMGNVINPIAHPERMLPFTVARSFGERLGSCLFTLLMRFIIIPKAKEIYDPMMQKYFPNVNKSYDNLVNNVDLQLVNVNPILGYHRPILSNTIPLGFLHIKPPKPLPSDLFDIMESSKHGIIYMSFGTIVTTKLIRDNFDSFMNAFADLPYDVLWKYDEELLDTIPSNVHIRKWFPQSDLLAHPKVKLFITHGVSCTKSSQCLFDKLSIRHLLGPTFHRGINNPTHSDDCLSIPRRSSSKCRKNRGQGSRKKFKYSREIGSRPNPKYYQRNYHRRKVRK